MNKVRDTSVVFRDLEHSKRFHNYGYYGRIMVEKVKRAIHGMRRGRAMTTDDIPLNF